MDTLSSQSSHEGGEASQPSMQSQMQMWVETVGGEKKGRIYGLGGETSFVKGASSSTGRSWASYSQMQRIDEVDKEVHMLREQNHMLVETVGTLKSEMQQYKQKFSEMDQYKHVFECMKNFFPPGAPRPPQLPYSSDPDNSSTFYPFGYSFMPPPYAPRPEEPSNIPSSSISPNENEDEFVDDDEDDL